MGKYALVAYGGNSEDVVLMRAFGDRVEGFFVDVGAGDPISGSLTKNLVDRLDWCGVNIEPLPDRAARLRRARPRDVTLNAVIGSEPGPIPFFQIFPGPSSTPTGNGLSTTNPTVLARHHANGWRSQELQVEARTLEAVLTAHAEPGFDLLKVDVEGSEAAVLASADLRKWRPRAIVVEATIPLTTIPSHHLWEPDLLAAGYELALFDGLNRFYARCDEPALLAALRVPANVMDNYIPVSCAIRASLHPPLVRDQIE